MKNFLLLLVTLVVLIVVVGGGGALFYLAKTADYSRTPATPPPSSPGY
jgi:flagellar basal body-associated protein FliL